MSSFHKRRAAAEPPSSTWRRSLRCELLESRHLLATLVNPWLVWYQDQDGDLVQVRLTQPLLSPANVNDVFRFADGNVNGSTAARQELETLDLSTLDVGPGLSVLITVIARSRLGDGVANVGSIEATGRSLSTVWVSGDVGAVRAGNFDLTTRPIATVVNEILARYDDNRDGQININTYDINGVEIANEDQVINTFSQMDGDFNLQITRSEIADYLSRAVDENANRQLSGLELETFIAREPIASTHLLARRGIDLLSVRSLGDTSKVARSITAAVDEVFRRYDVNANGQINFVDAAEVPQEDQYVNTFSRMDTNYDERIVRAELADFLSRLVDENADNTLSTLELGTYAAREPINNGHLFGKTVNRYSQIVGDVGRLDIRQHLIGAQLFIDGTLTNAFIGGSLLNVGEHTAEVAATFNVQRVVIGGNVEGRVVADRDLIYAQVNGSILGGAEDNSGNLGAGRDLRYVRVNGDVAGQSGFASGVVFANRNIGVASIGGSLRGGSGDYSGAILAEGRIQTAAIGRDLVGGATEYAPFAFGFVTHHTGLIRGRELINVTIGRDIRAAANGLTGVQAVETIGTLTIGRDVVGRADNQVTITAGGQPLTLARAAEDILKRYDKNKNGVIDVAQNIAKREVKTDDQINTFSAPDGNFDAKVSFNELREYLASTVDADFNGVLTPAELAAFQLQDPSAFNVLFGSGGPSTPLAEIAAQILRRYDANRDNRIDLRQSIARREVTTPEEINTFSAMDGDFNSFVSQAELLNYLSSTVDSDGDVFLTPAEAEVFQNQDLAAHRTLFPDAGIDLVPASGLTDLAIGRLIVGRDMIQTIIAAGYDIAGTPLSGDAQIGTIIVGRDWNASSALAGVNYPDGTPAIEFSLPGILSRIDTIIIGRSLLDGPAATVIAAQEVRRLQIGGRLSPLTAGPHNDDLSLTAGGLTRVIEAPRGL